MMDSPGFAEMVLEGHEVGPTLCASLVSPVGGSDGVEVEDPDGAEPGPESWSSGDSLAQAEKPASTRASTPRDIRTSMATG